MAVTTGVAAMMLGSTALQVGASAYGAKKQTSAAAASAKAQNEGLSQSIDWEREQEARRQLEWERTEKANREMYDLEVARDDKARALSQQNLDRSFNEDVFRDRRLEPYRVAGREALADLNQRRQGSMADLLPTGRI